MINEEQYIKENIGLVISQALKFKPTKLSSFEDFIQVGLLALVKAIRKFDPNNNKKAKLSTYSYKIIWRAILAEQNREKEKGKDQINTHYLSFDPVEEKNYLSDTLSEELPKLSDYENNLLLMRSYNYTLKEIGEKYNKSPETVRNHLNKIFEKLREGQLVDA